MKDIREIEVEYEEVKPGEDESKIRIANLLSCLVISVSDCVKGEDYIQKEVLLAIRLLRESCIEVFKQQNDES